MKQMIVSFMLTIMLAHSSAFAVSPGVIQNVEAKIDKLVKSEGLELVSLKISQSYHVMKALFAFAQVLNNDYNTFPNAKTKYVTFQVTDEEGTAFNGFTYLLLTDIYDLDSSIAKDWQDLVTLIPHPNHDDRLLALRLGEISTIGLTNEKPHFNMNLTPVQ